MLVSAWLINTLVCYHGINPFERATLSNAVAVKYLDVPRSLVLLLSSGKKNVQPDNDASVPKIKYRYRYIGRHFQNIEVFWKAADTINYFFGDTEMCVTIALKAFINSNVLKGAGLLLFRLTPF